MTQHILVEDADAAGGRQQQAKQHRERGGLAGAVAAQQRRGDAARHGEIDAVHGKRIAEALGQRTDLDDGMRHAIHDIHDDAISARRPAAGSAWLRGGAGLSYNGDYRAAPGPAWRWNWEDAMARTGGALSLRQGVGTDVSVSLRMLVLI